MKIKIEKYTSSYIITNKNSGTWNYGQMIGPISCDNPTNEKLIQFLVSGQVRDVAEVNISDELYIFLLNLFDHTR